MQCRPLDHSEQALWDDLVAQNPAAGFMQSSGWARRAETEGYVVHRLGLFSENQLIGGAFLFGYPSPSNAPGLLFCPEGPVLDWNSLSDARAGLRLLIQAARDLGALGLRIEPHLAPPAPSLLRNWQRAPIDLVPQHTLTLNLTLSKAELLSQMKPKGRYNIKIAERHGVRVRRSRDTRDLRVFYELFEETARRNQLFTEPYGYFLNLFAALPEHSALYLAEHQTKILAAGLLICFGARATYLYGGSSRESKHTMPCYAMHAAMIDQARAAGCTEYDFWGYDPFEQPSHLYAGISKFKTQFGGSRQSTIGAQDLLFYDRLADQIALAL
jgi:peptidoglycan pentaglycine glycine transferase (the first glycine)